MSRRLLWSIAGLAVCLGLFTSWFLNTFERVSVPRREAPQAEARQNRYLALERFLGRLGRPLDRTSDADVVHRLPSPGTLILDRGRAYHLTDVRQEALMRWVDGGGYLILVPELGDTPDPLVDLFDLVWTDTDNPNERNPASSPSSPPGPERLRVTIPGAARPLWVAFEDGLTPTGQPPDWSASDAKRGASVLHFGYGRGSVSVIAHLDELISNDAIADNDHAELVSTLLQRYQPRGAVFLLTRLDIPSLGRWLRSEAPLLLVSVAALLLAWLWSVVPRFGVAVPESPQERRELHEHLLAVGRYVQTQGGRTAWLAVVRSAVESAVARRHPSYRGRSDDLSGLAARAGMPDTDVRQAVAGDGATSDRFVITMRALQRVERSL
jgi:hypothetical protein